MAKREKLLEENGFLLYQEGEPDTSITLKPNISGPTYTFLTYYEPAEGKVTAYSLLRVRFLLSDKKAYLVELTAQNEIIEDFPEQVVLAAKSFSLVAKHLMKAHGIENAYMNPGKAEDFEFILNKIAKMHGLEYKRDTLVIRKDELERISSDR